MKILRIIYDWPPPWQGLAPHPYEITVSQALMGHQIDVFCGRWPKAGPVEEPKGVKIHPILREIFPGTVFFTSSVILLFKYLAWRRTNKVDVIHSHGHFAIWIYLYRRILQVVFPWASELKTPLIAHFHNTVEGRQKALEKEEQEIKKSSKYLNWPLGKFSDKTAVKVAAACVFVSEATRTDAITYYNADPKRCFVLESGVNTQLFVPIGADEKERSRRDLGLDLFDKVVLYHGAVVERKNVHLLVEALKFLPEHYKLLIVGSGSSSYLQELNERAKANGVAGKIINSGYTPYPHVPIAYQVSDIFVLPSAWEGTPKVVMQGLACGIPCLVSGFKLKEEIKGLYYLDNMEPSAIANRITEIIDNPSEVDSNKVRVIYSWDSRVKELEAVYDFAKKNYI